ncbi:MAG TPA: asparagine synthase-related protein, partial [Polyangiaceae bacterium]|nr:asparagine synthase-related protein [Polyangiaceae bacterium]
MSAVALELRFDAPPGARVVTAMLARMKHRGRDASGAWSDGAAALGLAATWTTPEDVGEAAPRVGSSGIVLALDGRLDDRAGLARALSVPDEGPDAALVLRAVERWWAEAPRHLVGDFAFVAWDPRERRGLLVRDRVGQRPLFYAAHGRGLRAASESRALFVDDLIPIRPDLDQLAFSLSEEYSETGATLLEGVRAVAPGAVVELGPRSAIEHRYWDPIEIETVPRSRDDAVDALEDALTTAVRARMRRRGGLGVFVSGGLDSCLVAALATELSDPGRGKPLLLTARFPDLACDESPFTARLARHLGAELASVEATDLDDPARYAPPPHEDLQVDAFNNLYAELGGVALARGTDVILDGWGSDELQWCTGRELEDALRRGELGESARRAGLFETPLGRGAWRRLASAGVRAWLPAAARHKLADLRSAAPLPDWLTPDARRRIAAQREARDVRYAELEARSRSQAVIVQGLVESSQSPCGSSQRLLAAAYAGFDLREPFADVRVVELLLSIPPSLRTD